MNCHLLIEMVHMLHNVRPSIIDGESSLLGLVGKLGLVDSPNKR